MSGKEHVAGRATTFDKAEVMEEHIHALSMVYPSLAGGVTITGGVAAWQEGAFAEIIPVDTITEDFDIHFIVVEDVSLDDIYELSLYAATTEIGRIRLTATLTAGGRIIFPPIPFQCRVQAKNAQIQAKLANELGGSETVKISLHYHEY